MDDPLDDLAPGIGDDDEPVMLVGEDGEARTMGELLDLVPALRDPAHATLLAEAANHLAHGSDYQVITDPAAYAEQFRARLARENPAEPFREGVVRLCDFGVPDFGAITPPVLEGGVLRFFAEDAVLGVPYEVEAADLTAEPSYEPMDLDPVPDDAGTPDDGAARDTDPRTAPRARNDDKSRDFVP